MRADVAEAQERLSAFQKESGIVGTDEAADFETQRLQELSSQLVALQAAVAESRSRAQTVRSASGDIAEVVSSPQIQGMRSELAIPVVLATACRVGELMNARWEHIDLDRARGELFSLHPDNTLLLKVSYWLNP